MAKQSRWRMDGADLKRRRQRQAASRRAQLHAAESLEARLALSVSSIANVGLAANQAQGLPSDWAVILGSNADNIFVQRVATGEVANPAQQDLLIATNSSFMNTGPGTFDQINNIDSVDSIYITNGQQVTVTNVLHDQYPLPSLPAGVAAAGPWQTTFVLSRQQIEDTEACTGVITYGGNIWTFTNDVVANSNPLADVYPSALFTFTGPGYPAPGGVTPPQVPIRPVGIAFADSNSATGDAVAIVTWSGFPVEALPTVAGPRLTITYDADNDQRGPVDFNPLTGDFFYAAYNQDFQTDVNRLPSPGATATFTVPVTNVHPGGIVNGTLRGLVDVTGDGAPDFLITPAQLFGPLENTLTFTDLTTGAGPALTGTFQTADGDSDARTVRGSYDPLLGTIRLQFFDGGNPQAVNGQVSLVQAQYATYEQNPLPMTATFFAGLDIHNEVYVDLLTSGSTINVDNPIIQTTQDTVLATGADIDLRATNVNVNATMSAIDKIRIGASRVTFPEIAQANAYAVVGAVGTPEEGEIVDIVVPAGWGGKGYSGALPVVVWIAPPEAGGTQAVATAVIQNGVVVSVTIDDPGSGYSTDPTLAPQVSISPPPALPPAPQFTQAPPFPALGLPTPASAAFAVVGSDPDLPNYGEIIDVVMPTPAIYGGSGYDAANPPEVFIAPPPAGGTPAVVTAVVVGGVVVGFTIDDPGSGYLPGPTSPPAVSIAPPALLANVTPVSTGVAQGIAVVNAVTGQVVAIGVPPGLGGQGYDALDPPVVFIAPPPAGGTQATAEAVVENGVVVRIDITDPGTGYTDRPAVTLAPPPPMPPIGPGFIDPVTREFPAIRATGQAPVAEQVSINAFVAAQYFDIRLGDDPATKDFTRGRLFVSNSGSLSGAIPVGGVPAAGAVQTPSRAVFVQADNADVIIEGSVVATEQTYLMQSRQAVDPDPTDGVDPEHEPYVFTTRSPATGAQTGTIAGSVLAVTLGNDAPTAEVGASALNTVDLVTRVDSIRIKAATRAGDPLSGPFPYDLTVSEFDGVTIDAVAASGRPISLSSGGDMLFRAALATGSDLTLAAQGGFSVTSPVASTRGQISITGTSVAVNNSLRVLDPIADPTRDDITLRASAGDLNLTGLVSAVNNVRLIQANGATVGTVGGPSRVVAARLNVEAAGAVSLFTNVDVLDGVAGSGFKIDEQDDITVTSLRSAGLVSLRAAGVDPGLENGYSDNAIALTAYLIDVTNLEVSAPKGSVAVIADTARTLVLGRADAIAAGLADPMNAAGTVTIRSRAGNIDVLDAPLPALPQNVVRVATTGDLAATYAQNQPGTRASTLTATANGSLNAVNSGTGIDGVTNLRVGDRVLVQNQSDAAQNGIYSITNLGSGTTRWVLTRATDADTPAKLLDNTIVAVIDGTQAGKAFSLTYGNVRGTSPIGVSLVPNRPDAVLVRAATEGSLFGVYDDAAGTITSVPAEALPLVNGVALNVGDRLLVRAGTHTLIDTSTRLPRNTTRVSNGVYEVVDAGGPGVPWQIQRIPEMDGVDDSGRPDPNELLGYVNVREGSLSTIAVQGAYRLAFRSLGISPLTATEVTTFAEIGSDNRDSLVTFVVSSAGATSRAAGSLGKMIALRQANATERLSEGAPAGTQAMDFRFSTLVARPIQLIQQLPEVTKPFVIDGAQRYTPAGVASGPSARIEIDGTRINVDRFGRSLFTGTLSATRSTSSTLVIPRSFTRFAEIRVGMLVTGAAIKAGAKVLAINAATRTLTLTTNSVVGTGVTSVTISTEINGLDFRAGTAAAVDPDTGVLQPGAILANVNVGGFANGAAVSIDGGGGALIRNTIIGQTASGSRLLSRFGVLVSGSTSSATILGNVIVGQSGAGVRVQDSASRVALVGNTIGSSLLPNEVGVSLGSTGSNRIGVDAIAPAQLVLPSTVTRNLSANTLTLPANYAGFTSLFVNLGVKGPGIATGARIAAINAATRTVTLTTGGVTLSGTGVVTFGNLVDTAESGTTLVLPAGVNIEDVYLGLGVSGAGIRPGSTVAAIDVPSRTITLSQTMTATATGVPVTFAVPARNTISFNRYGVVLAAGANTVTRSNIFNNTFDGIRIDGGQQTIGTSRQYAARSNSIYSNGGYGVNIVAPAVVGLQIIQGNFLGTQAPGTVRLPNRLGNISARLPKWTPDAITNVDPEGNVHGPGNRPTSTGGGSGGSGTGSGGTATPPGVFPL